MAVIFQNDAPKMAAAIDNLLNRGILNTARDRLEGVAGGNSERDVPPASDFASIPGVGSLFGMLGSLGVTNAQNVGAGDSGYFAAAATNLAAMRSTVPNVLAC